MNGGICMSIVKRRSKKIIACLQLLLLVVVSVCTVSAVQIKNQDALFMVKQKIF